MSGTVTVRTALGHEAIGIVRLVRHYRLMARMDARSSAFWRTMARTAIRTFRDQHAQPERLAA